MLDENKAEKIRKALSLLNPDDNDHWLDDGAPRTGVVQRAAKDTTITRSEIQEAWPDFRRVEVVPPEPEYESESDVVDFGEPIEPERFDVVTVESEMVTADEPAPALAPEPDEAPLTREECEQALRDLASEIHSLRNQAMILARQKIEAEGKARQAAVEFEIGGTKLSPLESAREFITSNQALRAASPQSSRGTAWQFVQKSKKFRGMRAVMVPDANGGQTLARHPDGSIAFARPRTQMDLGPMSVGPKRPLKV